MLIIDGNYLAHRSHWAIKGLEDPNGNPTNMIYGFLLAMIDLMKKFSPTHMVVCWDIGGKTWRHKLVKKKRKLGYDIPKYKDRKKDPKMEEEYKSLFAQMDRLKEILSSLSIVQKSHKCVEADDIVGHIVELFKDEMMIIIVTNDYDYFQLIDKKVRVYTMREEKLYGPKKFKKEFGISHKKWVDVCSLTGDGSDTIAGVKGIGPKNALKLIKSLKSIKPYLKNRKAFKKDPSVPERFQKVLAKRETHKIVKLGYKLKKIKREGLVELFHQSVMYRITTVIPYKFFRLVRECGIKDYDKIFITQTFSDLWD